MFSPGDSAHDGSEKPTKESPQPKTDTLEEGIPFEKSQPTGEIIYPDHRPARDTEQTPQQPEQPSTPTTDE